MKPLSLIALGFLALLVVGCARKSEEKTPPPVEDPARKSPAVPTAKKQPVVPKKPPLESRRYGGRLLAEWVGDLKNIDPKGSDGTAAVDGLVALVRDGDVPMHTRVSAANKLGLIGRRAESAVDVFIGFLQQKRDSGNSKQHAELLFSLKALTLLGPTAKPATPELIRLVKDSDWSAYVRAAAMEALARIGSADAKAVGTIIAMLTYAGDDGVSKADRMFLRRFAADAVGMIGPDAYVAIPRLRICMRHYDAELRRRCALALGVMRGKGRDSIAPLVDALVRDDSPAVRDAAVEALAMLGTLAIPDLLKLMKLDDADAKARAATALGRIGPKAKEALSELDFALDDDDGWVRINSAEAIWLISGNVDRAAAAMVDELRSPDRQIRIKAYRFFKTQGPKAKSAETALQRLLEHKRGEVRTAASKALQAVRATR